MKEETGFVAAKWIEIMKLHTSNSITDEVGYVLLAEELTTGEAEPEDLKLMKLSFQVC